MTRIRRKLNPDRPATYQIKVSGRFDDNLSDWVPGMTIQVELETGGLPTSTLTGTLVDQAALQGLLRRLYALGLPLMEVTWVRDE